MIQPPAQPAQDEDTPLALSQRLLDDGRIAEAMMAVELELARRPADAAALALRQRIETALAAMDPALARLELVAALHSDRPEAHYQLGHGYIRFGRALDARRAFAHALELAPMAAEVHASLAAAHLECGADGEAERCARRALELEPENAIAAQTLAALLEARGQADAAKALLEGAYARQALFVEPADDPELRVLVLASAGEGNTPYRRIMPASRYGRLIWYMEHARPDETPAPEVYDLVFNTIGDADAAGPSLDAVTRFLGGCAKPVLNRPDRVLRTRRDLSTELLAGLPDAVVPKTVRLDAAEIESEGFAEAVRRRGFEDPLLVRPTGSHGGQGLWLASSQADLDGFRPAAGLDHYLTSFVDYRSKDGLFRKYRVIFVDREPYPYHLALSEHWLVHHDTAGMAGHPERIREEARFLADPEAALGPPAMAAVRAIGRALDLDYAGVDFSVLADGRALVFEANATMLAHDEDPAGLFAYKNPYVARIADAFQAHLARIASKDSFSPAAPSG